MNAKEETSPIPGPDYSQGLSSPDEGHKLEALSADSNNKEPAETSLEKELKQELLALQRLVEKLKTASITADPNPIEVNEFELGQTTLSFTFLEDEPVEIHVGSPDGPLLARPEKSGKTETGKWVSDGMLFFLQDVSADKPLTREHTLATVTVRLSLEAALTAHLKRITNAFVY